jgi:hypothetical protein
VLRSDPADAAVIPEAIGSFRPNEIGIVEIDDVRYASHLRYR